MTNLPSLPAIVAILFAAAVLTVAASAAAAGVAADLFQQIAVFLNRHSLALDAAGSAYNRVWRETGEACGFLDAECAKAVRQYAPKTEG